MAAPARARRIDDLLALFDLQAHRKERMVGFSKGMKQKVALARALLHEPVALFLDEPTSGLDPISARAVRDLILQMRDASRSIVLCTHDLDEAERLADDVAILRRGQIVARGEPRALRARASAETAVTMLLAEPCPAALPAIGAASGLSALAVAPQRGEDATGVELTYQTANPREVNPWVIERLVGAGARIVSVTCATRSLEDVYAAAMAGEGSATR
jgi:ABC-2 type transport system ATP-binding protein